MKKTLTLVIASLFLLVSCWLKEPLDIINPEAEYRYFFWATCPHCQELNRIAQDRDLYSQISIEKREVYNNAENREIFLKLIEEIEPRSDGVPFVYDTVTWEVAVWVRPALELMTSRLGQSADDTSELNEEWAAQEDTQEPVATESE